MGGFFKNNGIDFTEFWNALEMLADKCNNPKNINHCRTIIPNMHAEVNKDNWGIDIVSRIEPGIKYSFSFADNIDDIILCTDERTTVLVDWINEKRSQKIVSKYGKSEFTGEGLHFCIRNYFRDPSNRNKYDRDYILPYIPSKFYKLAKSVEKANDLIKKAAKSKTCKYMADDVMKTIKEDINNI